MEEIRDFLEAGEELDQAAFARVWRRVMPEDRPDCPFTLNTPEPRWTAPVPSGTGETARQEQAGAAELPRLESLLRLATDNARICQALFRRFRIPGLSALAEEKRRQARRLNAARFLISGEPYAVSPTACPRFPSLALALRARFQAEQRLKGELAAAAGATPDACLAGLYRELAGETGGHARRLWRMVEEL